MLLGPFDWVFIICVGTSALYLSIDTAMKQSKSQEGLSKWLPWQSPKWNHLPLILMIIAGGILVGRQFNWFDKTGSSNLAISNFCPAFWGKMPGSENLLIRIDGRLLQSYAEKYKIVGVAFHTKNHTLPADADGLLKSRTEEIRDLTEGLIIPVDDRFKNEFNAGEHPTFYSILAVPIGLDPADFSTLRQALKMNVKILWTGMGPP